MGFIIEFFKVITILGDAIFILVGSTFIYLNRRKLGLKVGLTVLLAIYTANLLKVIFKIPRPPSSQWYVKASGYSFPSGHATDSAAFWGVIGLEYVNSKKWLSILSFIIIALVGISRVILGVHTWIDVIGGWILGLTFAFIACFRGESISTFYESMSIGNKILLIVVPYILSLVTPIPLIWGDEIALSNYEDMIQAISAVFGILIGFEFSRETYKYFEDAKSLRTVLLRGIVGVLILIIPFSLYKIIGIIYLAPLIFGIIGFLLVGVLPIFLYRIGLKK